MQIERMNGRLTVQFDDSVSFSERILGHTAVRSVIGVGDADDGQLEVSPVSGCASGRNRQHPVLGGVVQYGATFATPEMQRRRRRLQMAIQRHARAQWRPHQLVRNRNSRSDCKGKQTDVIESAQDALPSSDGRKSTTRCGTVGDAG